MIGNFLKVVLRYLLRSRFFTFLNIVGLSVGLSCTIVIYLFVTHELSYDRFQSDNDKIYRLIRQSRISDTPYNIGVTSGPYAAALEMDYPDHIAETTRALAANGLMQYETKSFMEDHLLLADKNFFSFFSMPLAAGDPGKALSGPGSIVISKAFARKYFGDDDPLGKMLRMDDRYDVQVTGIIDDLPGNTHLIFDAVASISLVEKEAWFQQWWNNSAYTYIKVNTVADAPFLKGQFHDFMTKYFGRDFERLGNRIDLDLEPLKDIYFNVDTRYEQNIAHGDKRYIYIFGSIGILILLVAAVNYINLATAQTSTRAKEVGVRKALGSSRTGIATQFLSESFCLCLISMVVALAVAQTAIPIFNARLGTSIPDIFSSRSLVYFLIGAFTTLVLLAGSYPSFLLASLKPSSIIKGDVKGDLQYLFIRKSLVVFQFSISIFMIIATLFIGRQLSFMRGKDKGFVSDQVVMLTMNNDAAYAQRQSLKEKILQQPGFAMASLSTAHPGGYFDASTVKIEGESENTRMRTLWSDEDLVKTLNISVREGRYFSREFISDSISSVVLNETAIHQLGWTPQEAIGKRIMLTQFDSTYKQVVGVVKDFHFTSMKEQIEPLLIAHHHRGGRLLIKMQGNAARRGIEYLERLWNSYNTGFPLEYEFLDDSFSRTYMADEVQGRMFTFFSAICLLVASLGILGLATFLAAQRKKEIGIRKVLGATVNQLSALLMKDLLQLVVLANLIAIPVGYWAANQWSESFAYRAPFTILVFIGGGGVVILVALFIVGFSAARTARENPIKSLRPE